MLALILQAQPLQSVPDIWGQLLTQGPLAILLGFCVWILWKRMNKLSDKLTNYMMHDREEMINCINANTKAMENHAEALKKFTEKFNH